MKARIAAKIEAARMRHQSPQIVEPRAGETHYTPEEIAALWKLHPSTVRRMFRDEPGVLKIGNDRYTTLRVPQSVIDRFHQQRRQ